MLTARYDSAHHHKLDLGFGFSFNDLYDRGGLVSLDPATGKTSHVFSCFNQDQPLDCVDFPRLEARLRQNSVQEKLTAQWIDRCLVRLKLRRSADR